jgi:peptidoglycan/xylan/chitin deacetylase (PgdA/CDA1 family)
MIGVRTGAVAVLSLVILVACSATRRDVTVSRDEIQPPPPPQQQPPPPSLASAPNSTASDPAPSSTSTTAVNGTVGSLPAVVTHGPRDRPRVALTFDSNLTVAMIAKLDRGVVASYANVAVIDELDRLTVPATFFLTGLWVERYPELARRLAADPLFELGSHGYSHRAFRAHCYGLGTLAPTEMAADVEASMAALSKLAPHRTNLFRFPGGCYDATSLTAISSTGVSVIQFDVVSGDAFGHDPGSIVRHTVAAVQNGSIVVLHVTGGDTAPRTADAVPDIVEQLRARGFSLVTVTQLLDQHH